jgi:hypothetical protein
MTPDRIYLSHTNKNSSTGTWHSLVDAVKTSDIAYVREGAVASGVWVSVKDRARWPEYHTDVLGVVEFDSGIPEVWTVILNRDGSWVDLDGTEINVTHWCPYPDLPSAVLAKLRGTK